MLEFARLTPAEREPYFTQAAARRGMRALVVEKDFWVCFMLRALFHHPALAGRLVFKGGTSLSKVYRVIQRFSEDVDLSLDPGWLGFTADRDPDTAESRSEIARQFGQLMEACAAKVQGELLGVLETAMVEALGPIRAGATYLEYRTDPRTRSPLLLFRYPSLHPGDSPGGIRSQVKLELGSLTDQRPVGAHTVTPWVAEDFPQVFREPTAPVVALEAERTFWEKATILHAEYHRPPDKPLRERFSRDCYDVFCMARHETGNRAMTDTALLAKVAWHKQRYFRTSWSNYQAAKPGTLKLVPPQTRLRELRSDYERMQEMFFSTPPALDEILRGLEAAERRINRSA